ncbi:Hsp20/alpha crystallin family protein [Rickettsia endosymbiont of Gonocerus acuteangulatus]|uniref:Hsp20/alpha crystallin family protein n=1 Tax=Rickettsia endosymbiont of Gonocerus acuteangulatus TaxID=3066266 RepID=UPI003133091E
MAFNLPNVRNKSEISNELRRRNYLDNIFDDFFNEFYISKDKVLIPKTDISETDTGYSLEVELPGINQKDIDINIDNHILIIKGHKEEKSEEKNKNYHMRERYYGSFQRSITLPTNIKDDEVDARFENGILYIKIPKKE